MKKIYLLLLCTTSFLIKNNDLCTSYNLPSDVTEYSDCLKYCPRYHVGNELLACYFCCESKFR